MNINEYRELLSLADALIFITESDLLSSILKDAGYIPKTFHLEFIIKVVADKIHSNLVE